MIVIIYIFHKFSFVNVNAGIKLNAVYWVLWDMLICQHGIINSLTDSSLSSYFIKIISRYFNLFVILTAGK